MREIKFRFFSSYSSIPTKFDGMFYSENYDHMSDFWRDIYGLEEDKANGFEGDFHVMQYTGLKDKNGKEIYEGDIVVEWEDNMEKVERFVVEWCGEDGYPAFDLKPNHFEETNALSFYAQNGEGYEIEIIGNIYEDKHLLDEIA